METKSTASSSSVNLTPSNESKIITVIHPNEKVGPSIREMVVIKRTIPYRKILTFRKVTHQTVKDPNPFMKSKTEMIHKKYSSEVEKKIDPLEHVLNKVCGRLAFSDLEQVLYYKETEEMLYRLFVTAVYTIDNYFGKPSPRSVDSDELLLYVHKLFPIGTHYQNAYYEVSKDVHSPKILIDLIILEGSGLQNVNNCGFLFCKVWMNEKPKWMEMTEIIESTTYPVWNVRFFFPVENMADDTIFVELYFAKKCITNEQNSDRKLSKKYPFKDIFKLKKSFNKSFSKPADLDRQSDFELIGKTKINVRDVYSEGVDEWILLACPRKENGKIFLHIEAKFRVFEFRNRFEGLKRHLMLLRLCVEDGIKADLNGTDGKIALLEKLLNRSALTLIFLHSVICSLTPSEDIVCRFIVIKNIGIRTESVTTELVYNILHETADHLRECPDEYIDNQLQQILEKEVKDFHQSCFQFISDLHSYSVEDRKVLLKFEYALRSLHLCEEVTTENISVAPLMVVKSEAVNWIEIKAEEMMETTPENRAKYVIDFLSHLIQYQKNIDDVISKVIHEETLTHLIYKDLDDDLSEPLKLHISEFCRVSLKDKRDAARIDGIEMFSKMKEFTFYISNTTKVPLSNLKMVKFREWFGRDIVIDWFNWSCNKAEREITKAVQSDSLERNDVNFETRQSTSATKTCEILQKYLTDLWFLISFMRSIKCDEMFLNAIDSNCRKYADLLLELALSNKLSEIFSLDSRLCLCILANNLWFLATWVERTIQVTIGKLPPNVSNTKLSLEDSCRKICSHVIDEYMSEMKRLMKCAIEEQINGKEGNITEYTNYLKRIIWQEIFIYMTLNVFKIALRNISESITTYLWQYIEWSDIKDANENNKLFEFLLEILTVTKDICTIPNNLEENKCIWGENYTRLVTALRNIQQNL